MIQRTVGQASMTGGLVAQQEHIVLPSISPPVAAVITVFSMLVGNALFVHPSFWLWIKILIATPFDMSVFI